MKITDADTFVDYRKYPGATSVLPRLRQDRRLARRATRRSKGYSLRGKGAVMQRSEETAAASSSRNLLNLDWYQTLEGNSKHPSWASAFGWGLDAFDFLIFSLGRLALLFLPEARGKELVAVD
jgi:hypothetical protein